MYNMSFFRKFVSRIQLRKRSGRSEDREDLSPHESSVNTEADKSLADNNEERTGDQADGNAIEMMRIKDELAEPQVEATDKMLRRVQKKLNKQLDMYRCSRLSVEQMASQLVHLQAEISTVMFMMSQVEKQKRRLETERMRTLNEMAAICRLVPEDISPEVRKKEPLYFKKYHNAKTLEDAQTLLRGIHMKQRALQHLEVLTFKKILVFEHQLPEISKNNNFVEAEMDNYVGEIMERLSSDRCLFGDVGSTLLAWDSRPAINNVGKLPASFDNPLFESSV